MCGQAIRLRLSATRMPHSGPGSKWWARTKPPAPFGRSHGRRARARTASVGGVTDLSAKPALHLDAKRLKALFAIELKRFTLDHPRSEALAERGHASLLGGVPMSWMLKWPGRFPIFFEKAQGARLFDVDGHEYVDLCLGDTAAMAGHSPPAVAAAVAERSRTGTSAMLPTEDALWVGEELQRRFGLQAWQFTLSATDANRFALRLTRALTGRPRVLVFNWCYHGSVDESFVTIRNGLVQGRPGNVGPPVDPTGTTRVVEFNDLEALERELSHGDVACVITEPALTNIGIVLPDEGFHAGLRDLTRHHKAYLLLDETHTLSAGPGGMTARDKLEPDIVTIGKAIGGGVPAAAFGVSADCAERVAAQRVFSRTEASGGVGGTLAGNALSLAAVRATLEGVLTPEAYARTIPLADRFAEGVEASIDRFAAPWHVARLGCRAEYRFCPDAPHTGTEAALGTNRAVARYLHVFALNRGILLTPFHSMALMAPTTTETDVDQHTQIFADALETLT